MKIQGNRLFLPLGSSENGMKVVEAEKETGHIGNGEAVQVTISEEGLNTYRDNPLIAMTGTGEQDEIRLNDQGILEDEKAAEYNKRWKHKNTKETTGEDLAYNHLLVYAEMYHEIVQGYEDGTRERYIPSPNTDTGYRKVTMEEELAALEKAAEYNAKIVYGHVHVKPKMLEKLDEAVKRTEAAIAGQKIPEAKPAEEDKNTRDILEELGYAIQHIKDNYREFAGDLDMLVHSAFKGNISISFNDR